MTSTAVRPEFSVVYIVGAVAVATAPVVGFHFRERRAMTIVAGDGYMRPGQRKVSLQVVVKGPAIPGNRVVAVVASIFKMTAVRVVVQVARDTGEIRAAEFLGFVTFGALGDVVVGAQ